MMVTKPRRSFIFCPPPSPLTGIHKSLSRLLGVFDFDERHGKERRSAELLVLLPNKKDGELSLGDLRLFLELTPESLQKVLVFDLEKQFMPVTELSLPSWLHVCSGLDFDYPKMAKWLMARSEPVTNRKVTVAKCRQAVAYLLSREKKPNFFKLIQNKLFEEISKSGTDLLKEKSDDCFLLAMLKISARYDQLEHDLMSQAHRFKADPKELGRYQQKKMIIDTFNDLRKSLQRLPKPLPGGMKKNRVLLIDDNPDQIEKQLRSVFKYLLSGFELCIWNPMKKTGHENQLTLNDLQSYQSLADLSKLSGKQLCLTPMEKEEHQEPESLKKTLEGMRYVLVDILLPDRGGRQRATGHLVIRGLRRFARDLWPTLSEGVGPLPGLVAISRADDITKIRAALRAGAGGYVLKSRLLALPYVLGGLARLSPKIHLHRNFRLLYNLPNDVIGYLQHTKLPVRDFAKSNQRVETNTDHLPFFVDLIRRLPKTDLHVHVGSCMTPEFLVIASLVGLARHSKPLSEVFPIARFWHGDEEFYLPKYLSLGLRRKSFRFQAGKHGVEHLSKDIRKHLLRQVERYRKTAKEMPRDDKVGSRYGQLRSILHQQLGISDFASEDEVEQKLHATSDIALFLFAMTQFEQGCRDKDDVIRLFILFLASQYKGASLKWNNGVNLLDFFGGTKAESDKWISTWKDIYRFFYKKNYALSKFRSSCWSVPGKPPPFSLTLPLPQSDDCMKDCPSFEDSPLEWTLATGTRCTNLVTYLEGCEFSGSIHLRHPYLIHLYAQQTLFQCVHRGLLYVELRGSPSGYEDRGHFDLRDVCNCLMAAFNHASEIVLSHYQKIDASKIWLGEKTWDIKTLFPPEEKTWRFPTKIGLILVGKRHKTLRQMIREVAASVVLHTTSDTGDITASDFLEKEMAKCGIVGFDLAGQEADFPPGMFKTEFEQLAKLHIPITVHSGENASVQVIEDAVLDLRASRIGHGLVLPDDPPLMNRLREENICVELCPVSNHQTNQFGSPENTGRVYPLEKLFQNGNPICINTDNPIISYTNIVKEYFQASAAYAKAGPSAPTGNIEEEPGLSLWQVLRIIRMGFIHSFMTLPERRAMLELADQMVFDLFSDPQVIETLKALSLMAKR